MTSFVTEAQLAEALAAVHHLQAAQLQARIERLTALLREHDIPLPSEDPLLGTSDGEHLAACRRVVMAAYDLLRDAQLLEDSLQDLRTLVGSGIELTTHRAWRV